MEGLYSSELLRAVMKLIPPATSTSPLASSVAVWALRAELMLPVKVQLPVTGLYNSALARSALPSVPPCYEDLTIVEQCSSMPMSSVVHVPRTPPFAFCRIVQLGDGETVAGPDASGNQNLITL